MGLSGRHYHLIVVCQESLDRLALMILQVEPDE
jgi:hypothetical protein